jgi:hypothetical protein
MSIQQQTVDLPSAWMGAAYNYGSSVDRQQAAPGSYPGFAMLADLRDRVMKRVIREALGDANPLGDSREPPVGHTPDCTALKYPDESFGRTVQ